MVWPSSVILITGASGFLGRHVAKQIPGARALSSRDLDLTDGPRVAEALADYKPTVVVHLAARVGGIVSNMTYQADFLVDNLRMDANLLSALRHHPPAHLITMLSTCMYPDRVSVDRYPMHEDLIEAGPPPPTNAAYAAAKRALWHGTQALHLQYGVPYSALVPCNLYGPGDHFGENGSHFLAAAVHKIETEGPRVAFMGTGQALRQYVYVEDVAALVALLVDRGPLNTTVNIAPKETFSIKALALLVAQEAENACDVVFTGEGPDGQYRKDVSALRLARLVPKWSLLQTPLKQGLRQTIRSYREHVATG